MDKIVRDFWWGFNPGVRHFYPKAWSKLTTNKDLGGLAPSLSTLNRALVCKLAWTFLTRATSLWAQVLASKYGRDNNLNFWSVQSKSTASPIWRSMLQIRNLMTTAVVRNAEELQWKLTKSGRFTLQSAINHINEGLNQNQLHQPPETRQTILGYCVEHKECDASSESIYMENSI